MLCELRVYENRYQAIVDGKSRSLELAQGFREVMVRLLREDQV